MLRRHLLVSLALILTLLPALCRAQAGPSGADPRLDQALAKVAAGELEEATVILEELVQTTTPSVQVRALLGALYVETERPQEGLDILRPLTQSTEADPAVLYNAGRAAAALGRIDEAEGLLRRSLDLAPGSPATRELGLLEAARGRYREGYALLKPWVAEVPDDEEARMIAALCAVQLKRPNEADKLVSTLPQDDPRVQLLRGKLLLDRFEYPAVIETLEPLMADPPPGMELDMRRTLAEAYLAVGNAAAAVETLDGHVGENPGVALQLAKARYQSADLANAITTLAPFAEEILASLESGQELPPPGLESSILSEYGHLLNTASRQAEAVEYLEMATRIAPDKKEGWQRLGQALAVVGRTDEARQALETFQEISQAELPASVQDQQRAKDVEDPVGRAVRQAKAQVAEGDLEGALRTVRQERAISPSEVQLALLESRILLFTDQPDEALEVAQQAYQIAPNDPDAHFQLGSVLMAVGQIDEAEAELRQALELNPDHAPAMNDLAVLLMSRQQLDEARQLLERVLEVSPDDELAKANLEQLDNP